MKAKYIIVISPLVGSVRMSAVVDILKSRNAAWLNMTIPQG